MAGKIETNNQEAARTTSIKAVGKVEIARDKMTKDVDKEKAIVESSHSKKNRGNPHPRCYICNGSHLAKNYPNQSKLNVIMAEDGKDGGSDSNSPQKVAPL